MPFNAQLIEEKAFTPILVEGNKKKKEHRQAEEYLRQEEELERLKKEIHPEKIYQLILGIEQHKKETLSKMTDKEAIKRQEYNFNAITKELSRTMLKNTEYQNMEMNQDKLVQGKNDP